MKSICIKTNNLTSLQYLQNELNQIDLNQICYSCNQFKNYKNIIIHYVGNNNKLFVKKISQILSLFIIDELEESFFNRIIIHNYFYFDYLERKQILELCYDLNISDFSDIFNTKFNILCNCFYKYLINNKTLILDGFINFRLKSYIDLLNDIVV